MFTYEVIETTDQMTNAVLTNVVRSDGALIPLDPANSDYAEYLRYTAWVEAGNNPEEFWTRLEAGDN